MVKRLVAILIILTSVLVVSAYLYFSSHSVSDNKAIDANSSQDNNEVKAEESNKVVDIPKFTIENIFRGNREYINLLPENRVRTIIATGDVIPARTVNYTAIQKNNFKWSFEKVYDKLNDADLTFINLESSLLEDCPIYRSGFTFCGDAKHTQGLLFAGVDIANLANNHAGNFGNEGIQETIKILNDSGVKVSGIDKPLVVDIKGMKFAFLGYNDITSPQPGVNDIDKNKIWLDILDAKKSADFVIVAVHWGAEYRNQPDDRQKNLAHFIIDSGADLIIGNHPHWIQPVEIYKDKLITYAHGNFVFDQEWSQKTKEGVVGKYTFFDDKLINVEFFPVEIVDYGQPYFLEGELKGKMLEEMYKDSLILNSSYEK